MLWGVEAADLGTSLGTLLLVAVAAVESFRARRAANRSQGQTETVRDAVIPDGRMPVEEGGTLLERLGKIERELHDVRTAQDTAVRVQAETARMAIDTRRAVDRVENDVATHLQLHSFMGSIRQRWPGHGRPADPVTPPEPLELPPGSGEDPARGGA